MDAKRAAQPDWPTVRYMVAGIQYAGRIIDDYDRLLMVGVLLGWRRGRQGLERRGQPSAGEVPCELPAAPTSAMPASSPSSHRSPPTTHPQDTYAERFYHPEILAKGAVLFRDERSGAGARRGRQGCCAGDVPAGGPAVPPSCACTRAGHPVPLPSSPPPHPLPAEYTTPDGSEIEVFRAAIEALPDQVGRRWGSRAGTAASLAGSSHSPCRSCRPSALHPSAPPSPQDNPELFGLHSNADLAFRRLQVAEGVQLIADTMPKAGGGGGGQTRAAVVDGLAADLVDTVPPQFGAEATRDRLRKLNPLAPLTIHLRQEIDR